MPSAETLIQVSLLGEAVDNGPIGILVADENMRYIAVNQFVCDMLGYTREQLLGLKVTDVARAPTASGEYDHMMRTGKLAGTVTLARADGTTTHASYYAGETSVAGMQLYVSVLVPDAPEAR